MGARRYIQPPPPPAPVSIERPGISNLFHGRLAECGVCGLTFHKAELVGQRGFQVCALCKDYPGYGQQVDE